MKTWIYLPLIFLCACSASKPARITIKPMQATLVPSEQAESIRYPETVKPYAIGRYVDPNNSSILHEEHTVFRVEAKPTWNLHPGAEGFRPFDPANRAFSPAPVNDDVIAEVNRQKAITQLMNQETGKLNHSLANLQETLSATQSLSLENQKLRQELAVAEKRLETLEQRWVRVAVLTNAASEVSVSRIKQ